MDGDAERSDVEIVLELFGAEGAKGLPLGPVGCAYGHLAARAAQLGGQLAKAACLFAVRRHASTLRRKTLLGCLRRDKGDRQTLPAVDGTVVRTATMRPVAIILGLALLSVAAPSVAQPQEPPPTADEAQASPELPSVQLEAGTAPTIGLAKAVETALAHNPTAVIAYDEIRRAQAIVEQIRSNALPTVYGNGTFTQLNNARVLEGVVSEPQTSLILGATLTVPIVVPRPWAQWSQSKDQVKFARASAIDTRRVIAVAVARAYLTIVAQKRVIDTAVRARDADKAHYEFAHVRLGGGVGNRIDEVRAEQQLRSDEANVEQQYANLTKDREVLGVLVGIRGPLDAEEPNLQAPTDPRQAMADAEHRTDVVAADARLKAARHAVHDNWTDYSPYLTGSFMPFYSTPATVTYPTTGWQAELLLTVPFYDAGLRYGQEKERGVARDEAQTQLEATLRQARSDVRTAFEELKRADAALAAARHAAELAETGLDLANKAYRAGASTNIEVIDAERTARDAETAVVVAEDGARQARLDLLAATGRFP
jgi:outer membrane protein TolC